MAQTLIKRHTKISIFMHWFNTVCWLFLLGTGVGLIDNPALQPLGMWWPRAMNAVFNGGANLLRAHEICGLVWAGVFLVYGLGFFRTGTLPFIKEIFTFSPKTDVIWLVKKGIQMTLGYKGLQRLGFEPSIPDQGFYNVGQKLFAIPALLGGFIITVTGVIMMLSKQNLTDVVVVQWSILIHFVTVGLVFTGLLVHIYMAAIAKGELPALISMFTGFVSREYAEHHHKDWYDEVAGKK